MPNAVRMAGVTTLANLASAISARAEEASIVAELKAGSENAYEWLIAHYHQPVYGLVYRILNDSADAADTTQEVFLKVFRGIKRFNGQASLKTWIYRIALHEASNQRRWWFRHKRRETSMEGTPSEDESQSFGLKETLVDEHESPFDLAAHEEIRSKVEEELAQVPEPFRTTLVLRDIEGLSYEEIAEILQVSLGTVKSRLMRGRFALKKRLEAYARQVGREMGLKVSPELASLEVGNK
ncbi:MAG TPA: sigma-70 family RNA polymerase sigma factor [Terriglobales bacterium]|nr:sigma-70 family RNA polymerase sigma factor [Terriglobales bacterium]